MSAATISLRMVRKVLHYHAEARRRQRYGALSSFGNHCRQLRLWSNSSGPLAIGGRYVFIRVPSRRRRK